MDIGLNKIQTIHHVKYLNLMQTIVSNIFFYICTDIKLQIIIFFIVEIKHYDLNLFKTKIFRYYSKKYIS